MSQKCHLNVYFLATSLTWVYSQETLVVWEKVTSWYKGCLIHTLVNLSKFAIPLFPRRRDALIYKKKGKCGNLSKTGWFNHSPTSILCPFFAGEIATKWQTNIENLGQNSQMEGGRVGKNSHIFPYFFYSCERQSVWMSRWWKRSILLALVKVK